MIEGGEWDGLLLEQFLDILGRGPANGGSEGERRLAASAVWEAVQSLKAGGEEAVQARRWVERCDRSEGGFGWWVGLLGLQPLKVSRLILEMAERGEL